MKCQKCGKELPEGTKFCTGCGTKVELVQMKPRFCTGCGHQLNPETMFCTNCGRKVTAEKKNSVSESKKGTNNKVPEKKTSSKKKIMISVALLMVVVLAGIGIVKIVGSIFGKENPPYFYVSNGSLYSINADGDKESITEIADNIGDDDLSSESIIQYSSDGKYLFYPENYDGEYGTFDLFCKRTFGKKEPVKIDSNVSSYVVSADDLVVYEKDSSLFISDKEDKIRISKDVGAWWLSDNKKDVIWYDSEETESKETELETNSVWYDVTTWYHTTISMEAEEEKLFSCLNSEFYTNDDFTQILYVNEDGDLVQIKDFTEESLVLEARSSKYPIEIESSTVKDGKIIGCTVRTLYSTDYSNYITDDCETVDEVIEYPYSWSYSSDAAYEQAYAAYEARCARDEIREELEESPEEYYTYEIYDVKFGQEPELKGIQIDDDSVYAGMQSTYSEYYNGEKCDTVRGYMLLSKEEWEAFEKVKLSQVTTEEESEQFLYDLKQKLADSASLVLENGGEWYTLDKKYTQGYNVERAMITKDDIYLLCYESGLSEGNIEYDDYGYLWKCSEKNGALSEPESFDEDVNNSYFVNVDGKLAYMKNYDEMKGDLYLDGELIDYDVHSCMSYGLSENKILFYDTTDDYETYDLYYWGNGYKQLIVEGVDFEKGFAMISSTEMMVVDEDGTMYHFDANAKEPLTQIAYDVDAVLPAINAVN